MEQLVPLLSRRRPVAHGPLGMKEKQAREVNGEEGPTLSKTKTERVGHPRGFSAASMRHPPNRSGAPSAYFSFRTKCEMEIVDRAGQKRYKQIVSGPPAP